ncbi:pseudaminic acid synthase [uncultured Clostridium sp.]|uniref:pseudaminic acid synthase n=1 Tax=uncultured Clostridium sp. TaxID=59620 RepID=UPI0025D396B5|nr:pseudaminic acid synthase [uncultured Clostridium sp.]
MNKSFNIGNFRFGHDRKIFIIAEMSANHMQNYERAVKIIKRAAWAGADAIKLQTYTPDTITLDCDNSYFQINQGTIWDGTTLYKLYEKAYTPWEWQLKLKKAAEEEGLIFLSSPFDNTAVDFLEDINVPAYKIASFEINDIPFIEYIASKKKPIIISTGIAHLCDIEDALDACRRCGNENVALLKCTSSYPSPINKLNLNTIPNMKETFDVITGLSDHTLYNAVPVAAAALGAQIIEKHLTLCRSDGGVDSRFSIEPEEFKEMVDSIRIVEKALGNVSYELCKEQIKSREHSRSLFAVKDIAEDELFTKDNVKSIRPGFGLETKYISKVLGRKSSQQITKGTPIDWNLIR